jgi:hypothetical protein
MGYFFGLQCINTWYPKRYFSINLKHLNNMNKRLSNKLLMYKAVLAVLNAFPMLLGLVPVLVTMVKEFMGLVDSIDNESHNAGISTTGLTDEKNHAQADLEVAIYNILSALTAYATRSQNLVLKAKTSLSESEIDGLKQDKLLSLANQTVVLATDHIADLASYGKTQADIDRLSTLIEGSAGQLGEFPAGQLASSHAPP